MPHNAFYEGMRQVFRLLGRMGRARGSVRRSRGRRDAAFGIAFTVATLSSFAADSPPDFRAVYDLIRTNLPGVTSEEFNRAAVKALVNAFGPNVAMSSPTGSTDSPLISKLQVFDSEVVYLRIPQVREGLPQAVRQAFDNASSSNKVKGLVLDLRYANGQEFAVAASVVDLFLSKEKPLLTVSGKTLKSASKSDAITVPVAVLVNRETAGAPEAMAAVFRETGTGLILGNQTAGQTAALKDYPLGNGEEIRIASEPVLLGDGSPLAPKGVVPDIVVPVNSAAERAWFEDAFAFIPSGSNLSASVSGAGMVTSTNRPSRRPRISEADLVRERREGITFEEMETRANEPDKPQIGDPALARAIDLLKGLAVVRRPRT